MPPAPIDAQFPPKLRCLFAPEHARYRVLHGGRGGAKSWSIARALLIKGAARPERILCARELMMSIADSVHKLLADQIEELSLAGFYTVEKATIRGANGTEFRFAGLKNNISSVKSFEGITVAWIEEADNVSKASWNTLIPTIRRDNSEIWVSFNPQLESDETYRRFVLDPPAGAIVTEINWRDNPWFPSVLREEMEEMRRKDPDSWLNIWEGKPRQTIDGAVYARELREAEAEGRICRVPYDRSKPVHTFWDLGWADHTAIWLGQIMPMGEVRCIDYIEGAQRPLNDYLLELQGKGYVYGADWLPHDARAKQLGTGKSIEDQVRAAGRRVQIVPRLTLADGINAARTVFPNAWFDRERCADGLQRLRHYRFAESKIGGFKREPEHDEASHGADAFRYLAVSLRPPKAPQQPMPSDPWERRLPAVGGGADGRWMGI